MILSFSLFISFLQCCLERIFSCSGLNCVLCLFYCYCYCLQYLANSEQGSWKTLDPAYGADARLEESQFSSKFSSWSAAKKEMGKESFAKFTKELLENPAKQVKSAVTDMLKRQKNLLVAQGLIENDEHV